MRKWLQGDGFSFSDLGSGPRKFLLSLMAWLLYKLDQTKLEYNISRSLAVPIWGTDRLLIMGYTRTNLPDFDICEDDFDAAHDALDDMLQGFIDENEMERRQRFQVVK